MLGGICVENPTPFFSLSFPFTFLSKCKVLYSKGGGEKAGRREEERAISLGLLLCLMLWMLLLLLSRPAGRRAGRCHIGVN